MTSRQHSRAARSEPGAHPGKPSEQRTALTLAAYTQQLQHGPAPLPPSHVHAAQIIASNADVLLAQLRHRGASIELIWHVPLVMPMTA